MPGKRKTTKNMRQLSRNPTDESRKRNRKQRQSNTEPKNTHQSLLYKSNHTLKNEVIQQLLRSVNTQLPSEAERCQRPRLGLDDKDKDSIKPFIASLLDELFHHTASHTDRPQWSIQSTEDNTVVQVSISAQQLHLHRSVTNNIRTT
jgi:hypothetical protein